MNSVPGSGKAVRTVLLVLVLAVSVGAVYVVFARTVTPVVLAESGAVHGEFRIADFLYQVNLTEAYWSGEIETPYSPNAQARVLEVRFGSDGRVAMAHGLSPVSLVLWYPFAILARADMGTAYSVWLTVSFVLFTVAVARIYGTLSSRPRATRIFFVASTLAVVASRVGWRAFGLGQSAPVGTVGLLLLVGHLTTAEDPDGSDPRDIGTLLLSYLMVSWKLHYIGLAGGLHLMLGSPRRALAFGSGTIAFAVGIPSVLDFGLVTSFLEQLTHFAGREFTSDYVQVGQAASGGSGVTLRRLLRGRAPDGVVDAVSWSLFGASVVVLAARRLRGASVMRGGGTAVVRCRRGVLFLASVLVLFPYLGRYDDLFLVVGVALVVVAGRPLRSRAVAALCVLALATTCLAPAPDLGGAPELILTGKTAVLVSFWWLTSTPKDVTVLADD